jgi:LPXTG-motif cell wall-anchored protein
MLPSTSTDGPNGALAAIGAFLMALGTLLLFRTKIQVR